MATFPSRTRITAASSARRTSNWVPRSVAVAYGVMIVTPSPAGPAGAVSTYTAPASSRSSVAAVSVNRVSRSTLNDVPSARLRAARPAPSVERLAPAVSSAPGRSRAPSAALSSPRTRATVATGAAGATVSVGKRAMSMPASARLAASATGRGHRRPVCLRGSSRVASRHASCTVACTRSRASGGMGRRGLPRAIRRAVASSAGRAFPSLSDRSSSLIALVPVVREQARCKSPQALETFPESLAGPCQDRLRRLLAQPQFAGDLRDAEALHVFTLERPGVVVGQLLERCLNVAGDLVAMALRERIVVALADPFQGRVDFGIVFHRLGKGFLAPGLAEVLRQLVAADAAQPGEQRGIAPVAVHLVHHVAECPLHHFLRDGLVAVGPAQRESEQAREIRREEFLERRFVSAAHPCGQGFVDTDLRRHSWPRGLTGLECPRGKNPSVAARRCGRSAIGRWRRLPRSIREIR